MVYHEKNNTETKSNHCSAMFAKSLPLRTINRKSEKYYRRQEQPRASWWRGERPYTSRLVSGASSSTKLRQEPEDEDWLQPPEDAAAVTCSVCRNEVTYMTKIICECCNLR